MKNTKVIVAVATVIILGTGATFLFSSSSGIRGSFYSGENPSLNKPYQVQQNTVETTPPTRPGAVIPSSIADKGSNTSAPTQISFTFPANGANLDLSKVKTNGLAFTATDPNTTSHSKDANGTFYPNYNWELKDASGKSVWSTGWIYDASKITVPTSCITEFVGLAGKYMTCPNGTIPASFFSNISAGNYTLSGTVGDGQIGTSATVAFTIGGGDTFQSTISDVSNVSTSHQAIINTFKIGLVWELKQAGIMDTNGNYTYIYRIHLNDEAKKTLAFTNDDKFYFKYVYKPYWGPKAGQIIESEIINFNVTPGKGLSSTSKNKSISSGEGDIYVAITLPWPGLATASELAKYDANNWGRYDVDIYFYDANVASSTEKRIDIASTYRTEKIDRPELYLSATSSGCLGYGDFDFQVGNSGGPLPYNEYKRILLYASGDGYGPTNLDSSFGTKAFSSSSGNVVIDTIYSPLIAINNSITGLLNSIPKAELFVSKYYGRDIMKGHGAKSDWECHDAGNGGLYLVRDTIKGDTTIYYKKVNP